MELLIIPAIDLVDGQAVRLVQGEAKAQTDYGDPLARAQEFAQAGAKWLHLVDLDAAFGRGSNYSVIEKIVRTTPLQVEVSGGLRDDATLARMFDAGAARVNLGTAALENPQWCGQVIAKYGQRVAIGLDVRAGRVASRGWTEDGPLLETVLDRLESQGACRYVVTDVSRDGTLEGPGQELLRTVCARTQAPVVASGGVASLGDIAALRDMMHLGIEAAIVGKALYAGRFTLAQALAVAARSND